jgi:hypothetical protein
MGLSVGNYSRPFKGRLLSTYAGMNFGQYLLISSLWSNYTANTTYIMHTASLFQLRRISEERNTVLPDNTKEKYMKRVEIGNINFPEFAFVNV